MNQLRQSCCWSLHLIPAQEIGLDYKKLFEDFLDDNITRAILVDPHLRTDAQQHFFRCFLQLIADKCKKIERIDLVTQLHGNYELDDSTYKDKAKAELLKAQMNAEVDAELLYQTIFETAFIDAAERNVKLHCSYKGDEADKLETAASSGRRATDRSKGTKNIHDRSLTFQNGVHLVLGRGLDIYNTCQCPSKDKLIPPKIKCKKEYKKMKDHYDVCDFKGDKMGTLDLSTLRTKETMLTCLRPTSNGILRASITKENEMTEYVKLGRSLGVKVSRPRSSKLVPKIDEEGWTTKTRTR